MKTFDSSTRAALPGNLKVSRRMYARYFGDSPGEWLTRTVCCRLPWFMHRWPGVGTHLHHWTQMCEVLEHGCLNPAMVLDTRRGLVAAFTNLSNHERRPRPVIKIFEERLHLIAPPVGEGARIAVASVYWRKGEDPRADWDDFSPIVTDCLADGTQCRAARERIKPTAWAALDAALAGMTQRDELGLFTATVPDAMVRAAF